jgi:hypothetical protein
LRMGLIESRSRSGAFRYRPSAPGRLIDLSLSTSRTSCRSINVLATRRNAESSEFRYEGRVKLDRRLAEAPLGRSTRLETRLRLSDGEVTRRRRRRCGRWPIHANLELPCCVDCLHTATYTLGGIRRALDPARRREAAARDWTESRGRSRRSDRVLYSRPLAPDSAGGSAT